MIKFWQNQHAEDTISALRKTKRTIYHGDAIATGLLVFFVVSALSISTWSLALLITGNIESGGPIGMAFSLLQASGIIK